MTIFRALLPVYGLLLNVLVQLIAVRSGFSLLRSIFTGFAAGLLYVLWGSRVPVSSPGDILSYGALGYCYFHFLNLGETARRIRLLRELYEHPGGLSEAELLARYDSRGILAARMERLLSSGQLLLRGGRYYTGSPAVLLIARMTTRLKLIVTGRKSEFDNLTDLRIP
jgi:hypothetical protein